MSVRIDWPKIKEIMGSVEETEPYLFILPHGGRHILLALSRILAWEATFRTGDYDFADWDELQALVAEMQRGLMGETTVSDLTDVLNAIVNQLINIDDAIERLDTSVSVTGVCCDSQVSPTPDPGIEPGIGDPPPDYGGQPTPEWSDYQAYVCGAALAWSDSMEEAFDRLEEAVENSLLAVGGVAALLGILALVGILISVSFYLAAGLFAAIVGVSVSDVLGDVADWFADHKIEIANIIYCANSAEQATVDLKAYLEANMEPEHWLIVRWFDIENNMNIIYAGEADGVNVEVEPSSICSCASGLVYGFTKLTGEMDAVTLPLGLAQTSNNWDTTGVVWFPVWTGNWLGFVWEHEETAKITYRFVMAPDSADHAEITAIVNLDVGTEVIILVSDAEPGQTYEGEVPLAGSMKFASVGASYVSGPTTEVRFHEMTAYASN